MHGNSIDRDSHATISNVKSWQWARRFVGNCGHRIAGDIHTGTLLDESTKTRLGFLYINIYIYIYYHRMCITHRVAGNVVKFTVSLTVRSCGHRSAASLYIWNRCIVMRCRGQTKVERARPNCNWGHKGQVRDVDMMRWWRTDADWGL